MKTVFFTAQYACEILWASETHTAVGTDSGSVTLQLEVLTGTGAPGSGTEMLITPWNLKGAINTVETKMKNDFVNSVDARILDRGDRIALKYSGTLTGVAGVNVTLGFKPLGRGHYRKP